MAEPKDDLDAQVRKADPDRWLSSRFIADPDLRADVIAVYALDAELAGVSRRTTQPMLGEIRLAWWREALEELAQGSGPREHPVLSALAQAHRRSRLPLEPLLQLVEARGRDLDPNPLTTEAEALAYADQTAGAVAVAVARMLDSNADPHLLSGAARAWALAGLIANARAELGADGVGKAIRAARGELAGLPASAFPAVAHAALVSASGRRPGQLEARLRLVWAVARGTI